MSLSLEYAGMEAWRLAAWIGLATVAGAAARQIVRGKPFLGLWGDMAIGLVGAFAVGWVLRQLDVDLSQAVLTARPGIASRGAILIDVLFAGFAGALILRALLRLAKQ